VVNIANKELALYIMDQLEGLEDIKSIPMMGGYLFYYKGKIFGGIYLTGFMVKITKSSKHFMPDTISESPYEGAKPMLHLDIDDSELLKQMVVAMYEELPEPKQKKKKINN